MAAGDRLVGLAASGLASALEADWQWWLGELSASSTQVARGRIGEPVPAAGSEPDEGEGQRDQARQAEPQDDIDRASSHG